MSARRDEVRAFVDGRRDDILALLCDLIRIDSVTGNESDLARFCADWNREHDIPAELEPCLGRFNATSELGSGRDALVISGHLDTVPANEGAWTYGPWTPTIADDRVFGLGASDLKASIAGAYFASLFLKDRDLAYRWITAFTVEEETTGHGTREFLNGAVGSGRIDPARTVAVVTEPTGLDHVSLGNRGAIFAFVEVRGLGGHGSRPHLARNPVEATAHLVAALPELVAYWNERHHDPAFADYGGITVTPTSHQAGSASRHNVIPQIARMVLDCRLTAGLYKDGFATLQRELRAFLRDRAGDGFEVSVQFHHPRAGQKIASDHPIVGTAMSVLRDDLEIAGAATRHNPAGNDAVYFEAAGIPALNKVGPGHPDCAHRVDEYVRVDNVLRGVEFFIHLGLRWDDYLRGRSGA